MHALLNIPSDAVPDTTRSFRDLPFITRDGTWAPARSGDYATDCDLGRQHAEAMLQLIQETRNPIIFGSVARAMTEGGVFEGIEVGFCQRIAINLIVA